MARALCCVFIVFIACVPVYGKEHTSHKDFDKPADQVFEAAERVASHIGAEIRQRNASTRTLVFSSSQSLGMEQYSGYRATFVAEEQPNVKAPKTTARLRVNGIRWSHLSGGYADGYDISWEFYAALKRELGLCKPCKTSRFRSGGGLLIPRVRQ